MSIYNLLDCLLFSNLCQPIVIKSLPATSLKRKRDQHMLTGAGGGVYWWPERVTEGGETEGETKSNIEMTSEPMAKTNTEADGQLSGGGEFRKRRKSLTPSVYNCPKDNLQTIHPKYARLRARDTRSPLCFSLNTSKPSWGERGKKSVYEWETGVGGGRLPGQQPHHGDSSESCCCFLLLCHLPPPPPPLLPPANLQWHCNAFARYN